MIKFQFPKFTSLIMICATMEILGSNFNDINLDSIKSYRSYLRDFNHPLSFLTLNDENFCRKLNIVLSSGKLSYGSLLMFGKRESVLGALPNFWIDYMEFPLKAIC